MKFEKKHDNIYDNMISKSGKVKYQFKRANT